MGLIHHSSTARQYTARTVVHDGKDYIIVPVTMMVEGVHSGSRGPIFHPAEELSRFTASWDGIPIVINHPVSSNGSPISANSPNVIESEKIGRVFNTRYDNGLKSEAWIEVNRIKRKSNKTFTDIKDGKPIEVSVGVFTDEDNVNGTWNGEAYRAVARNHRPDHLALLPDERGACSFDDGCGIRINKEGGENVENVNEMLVVNALKYNGTEKTTWSAPSLADFGVSGQWADLSADEKGRIASHYLIGSATSESFAELKLPVVNPSNGKLNERALRAVISGRGASVQGVSQDQLSAIRRRAYRLLNSEFDANLEIPETLSALKAEYAEIVSLSINSSLLGRVENLRRAVDSLDNDKLFHYLEDITESSVIYRKRNRENDGNKSIKPEAYLQQQYSIDESGNVTFVGEPVEVRREVKYLPISTVNSNQSTKKEYNMENKKSTCFLAKVDRLIANSTFEEKDKEWLLAQEEPKLDKFLKHAEPNPQVNSEQAIDILRNGLKTTEDFIALAPTSEMQDVLNDGIRLHKEKRATLVANIMTNAVKDTWKEEELNAMKTETLEKISKGFAKKDEAQPFNYAGQGNPVQVNANATTEAPLLPCGLN